MIKIISAMCLLVLPLTGFASDMGQNDNTTVQVRKVVPRPKTNICSNKNECYGKFEDKEISLQPLTVKTGKTIIIKEHYEVYKPKIVYEKIDSFTTTKTCVTCKQ